MYRRDKRWLYRQEQDGKIFYDADNRKVYRDVAGKWPITSQDLFSLSTFDYRAPLKVYFDFTYLCNLECRHCITNSSPRVDRQNELSSEQIVSVMNELARIGVLEIGVGGGEPLCYPDIFPILDHAREVGLNVVLTTNGLLVSTKIAQRLKEVQVSEVRVSFDGSQAVHDNIRGAGTYLKALKSIGVLLHNGVKTVPRITLCNDDKPGLDLLFKELAATSVSRVKVCLLEARGRAALKENQELFRYPRNTATAEYLVELAQKHGLELKLPDDMAFVTELADGQDLRRGKHRTCGAGLVTAYISPYGHVQPCSALPKWVFGNVRSDSFMSAWTGQGANKWRQCACSNCAWKACTHQDPSGYDLKSEA